MPAWSQVTRMLASLIAPPTCALCGSACAPSAPICGRCDRSVAASPPSTLAVLGLDSTFSAVSYEGRPRDLVSALKFAGRLSLARRAAEAIAAGAPAAALDGALVPVPAVSQRQRRRGFDPAGSIAAALAEASGLELRPCLIRLDAGRQVGRPRRRRLADPPRVRLAAPAPERAVLVDDVITTGATLAACSAALRSGGCRRVTAVAFARALGSGTRRA